MDHTSCIIHGHCLNHVNHPDYKYCPMKVGTNYREVMKSKSLNILNSEKRACKQQIKYLKTLNLREKDKTYYNMLIDNLEKLLIIYSEL